MRLFDKLTGKVLDKDFSENDINKLKKLNLLGRRYTETVEEKPKTVTDFEELKPKRKPKTKK